MEHYRQSSTISNLVSDWHFGYIEKFQCYFNICIYYYLDSNTRCCIFLNHVACQTVGIESRWCGTSKCLWGSNHVPHIALNSTYNQLFWLKSMCTEPGAITLWRGIRLKCSDSHGHKRQQTANDEEVPNLPKSLLSLPNEILQSCISFVGNGHYQFVGSICNRINEIYAHGDEDMKLTFWSNVAVSRNLAELCLKDHQKLGQRIYQIQSMVATIKEVCTPGVPRESRFRLCMSQMKWQWRLWNNTTDKGMVSRTTRNWPTIASRRTSGPTKYNNC